MPITESVIIIPGRGTPHRSSMYSIRPVPPNHSTRLRATSSLREYTDVMATITSITISITANSPVGTPITLVSTNLMPTTNITTAKNAANSTSPLIPSRYSTKKSAMKVSAEPVSFWSSISTIGTNMMAIALK